MTREERILDLIIDTDKNFAPYYGVLPKLIRDRGYKRGIEVGVFAGGHAKVMLDNADLELLVGIDPYKIYKVGGMPRGIEDQEDMDCLCSLVRQRLNTPRFRLLRMTSDKAVSLLVQTYWKFDFVFVDGCHTYEQLKKDLDNYDKIIRKGGIIACHDYKHPTYSSLTVAVDEFAKLHNTKIVKCPLFMIYMEKTW